MPKAGRAGGGAGGGAAEPAPTQEAEGDTFRAGSAGVFPTLVEGRGSQFRNVDIQEGEQFDLRGIDYNVLAVRPGAPNFPDRELIILQRPRGRVQYGVMRFHRTQAGKPSGMLGNVFRLPGNFER